tara:strand:- start:767 stop:1423 length:657 start_codon:yes stop_codon:yes gene_type:complete
MFSFSSKRQNKTQRLKLCIGGDGGVGKTSYFKSIIGVNEPSYKFNRDYNATPLSQYNLVTLKLITNKQEIILDIWDTAGQEFVDGDLRECFLSNADGALILYDIQNAATRNNVGQWLEKLRKICGENVSAVIIGNKMDIIKDDKSRSNIVRECRFKQIKNIETMLFSVKNRNNYNNPEKKGIKQVLDPIELYIQMYYKDRYLQIKDIEIINIQLVNST